MCLERGKIIGTALTKAVDTSTQKYQLKLAITNPQLLKRVVDRTSFTNISYERLQMRTLLVLSGSLAVLVESHHNNGSPCFLNKVACSLKSSSPTLREIEFTMGFPWHHFNPAMTISNLDASSINGTLAISGSVTPHGSGLVDNHYQRTQFQITLGRYVYPSNRHGTK
jgi:hypothetical protein